MSSTYSLSIGQPIESYKKPDINSVLLDLPDNTQKLISPKDVRDAFLFTWASSAFKHTINQSSVEYIGIDSGNPENRDIKQKILIGKRSFTGTDVMNNDLLSGDSDVFFYNTKPDDSATQSITRVSILAGTNSILNNNAPYIQSRHNSNRIDLDIVNPSEINGPINIYSEYGRVSLNGILFPTIAETSASASNGRILKYYGTYPNGALRWADPSISISSIGSSNIATNIYGSPSNLNGYSLEFVNDSIVPVTVGGIEAGSSFSAGSFNGQNWPLSEIIRKILYPYVPPGLSFSVKNTLTDSIYAEAGVTSSVIISYHITRYSSNIYEYYIQEPTGNIILTDAYTASVGDQLYGTFSTYVYKSTSGQLASPFSFVVSDEPGLLGSYSLTASITFVNPFFTSFTSSNINISNANQVAQIINGSNRVLNPPSSLFLGSGDIISANYNGSGYIYFMIPSSYNSLSKIKDPNGYTLFSSDNPSISSFTYSGVITPVGISPSVNYGSYIVYKIINACTYTGSGDFQFIF